jgi:thiol-disulfide isomerase/thioredoxin
MPLLVLPLAFSLGAAAFGASLAGDVRQALDRGDFAAAGKMVEAARAQGGITPEWLEAHSWLGRGALAAKDYDKALALAAETRRMALELLGGRKIDAVRPLPTALGASIEVQAQATAAQGERSQAIDFLRRELEAWRSTSMRIRIEKNINLLTLEGRPAPPLDMRTSLGGPTPPLASLKGRPVLLFFWAHWCGQCKSQVPMLVRLAKEFDLKVIGPTALYGYVTRGEEATPERETAYIDEVRQKVYGEIPGMTAPISDEDFRIYGASTVPTYVLLDARGIVRLYRPGLMTYEELSGQIRKVKDAGRKRPR